jgi:S1-C subfamily serine protease
MPAPQAGGASEITRRYGFTVAADGKRVMVAAVREAGRAQLGGLRTGDEILKVFDGKPNTNFDLLWSDMMSGHITRNALLLQVRGSDGSKRDIRITDRY